MADLSIFKLDSQTITIKDTTARQAAESAKTLATIASGNATTALNKINELESEKADAIISSTSGAIASFPDGADGIPLKSCIVQIEPVQEGTGDPSPDNVRPISGLTGAKVTRAGKNLANIKSDNADNSQRITISGDEGDLTFISTGEFGRAGYVVTGLKVGQRYTFSAKVAKTATSNTVSTIYLNNKVKWNYAYGSFNIGSQVKAEKLYSQTFVATTDVFFVGVYVSAGTGYPDTITFKEAQLELGSTATAYEPYQGDTYDITFPSEAGTVYGGSLDVTNGMLTVDRAQIASYAGETLPSTWISDRDVYSAGATPTTGAQVVYELATPITYQLTPQEVSTLLGQNNIWADTGDMSVTYRADTKLYIQNLTKPTEDDMTANAAITSGKFFMINNRLFLATAAIASGAMIIPGTNCSELSLADALNNINS